MNIRNFSVKIFALFIVIVSLASCSKDDDSTDQETINQIEDRVESGTWRITKFIDSGDDETSNFSGYNFTFNSSGTLNANNGSNDYNGTWSVTDSNSSDDDDSFDDLDFNISFNLTNNFEDLNDDWDILSHTSTKIELKDVSGGNGGTDYLTFEKN